MQYFTMQLLYGRDNSLDWVRFEGCNGVDWAPLSAVPTIYSSGQAWMDRNLGASQVAISFTNSVVYGDH